MIQDIIDMGDLIDSVDGVKTFSDMDDMIGLTGLSDLVDISDMHDNIDPFLFDDVSTCNYDTFGDGGSCQADYSPTFTGNPPNNNADNYIHEGKITLESINGNKKTFECYSKAGSDFVYEDGQWKKISGLGTVNIHNIQYKKV